MADIVRVRTTAFIDDAWILFSSNTNFWAYYEGNDRGFTYDTLDQPAKFKMAHHVIANFVTGSVDVYQAVGPTREKIVWTHDLSETIRTYHTNTSQMSHTASMNTAKTQATVYLRGASNNPAITGSPNIDWEYNLELNKNGTVKVTGKHDGYPCHEIWKKVDSNTPVSLYTFQKQTPASLFPPMEHSVNVTG